ncbi:hypothetical protein KKC13_08330 [bacterium]|nr:hypothetical protein [bacterium]MBU1959469.1 hypothetical protein [bacterium]
MKKFGNIISKSIPFISLAVAIFGAIMMYINFRTEDIKLEYIDTGKKIMVNAEKAEIKIPHELLIINRSNINVSIIDLEMIPQSKYFGSRKDVQILNHEEAKLPFTLKAGESVTAFFYSSVKNKEVVTMLENYAGDYSKLDLKLFLAQNGLSITGEKIDFFKGISLSNSSNGIGYKFELKTGRDGIYILNTFDTKIVP